MHKFLFFLISLLYSSTCFEDCCVHHREVKLYYTASGIVTPVGGRLMRRLREDCAPNGHLHVWWYQMLYNTILTSWCSKHVEECNQLIKKTRICALSWSVAKIILRCTVSKTSKLVWRHSTLNFPSLIARNQSLLHFRSCLIVQSS